MEVVKKSGLSFFLAVWLALWASGCDALKKAHNESQQLVGQQRAALALAKENRLLKAQARSLSYELTALKSRQRALSRGPASVAAQSPEDLLKLAQWEFQQKHYNQAFGLFRALFQQQSFRPQRQDFFLFQAALSAMESGHPQWAQKRLRELIRKYPLSSYFRPAKLWLGLSLLKEGRGAEFFSTVEEFRRNYQNTQEWELLSEHYEKIFQTYKK